LGIHEDYLDLANELADHLDVPRADVGPAAVLHGCAPSIATASTAWSLRPSNQSCVDPSICTHTFRVIDTGQVCADSVHF
jgi:hypothetical protein